MGRTKKLEIIFHNGNPDGLRTYMRHLSPVVAHVVPRLLLGQAKGVTGIHNPGVYFLINDTEGALTQLYIGQTQNGISRLDDHKLTKDFWNKAVLFLAESSHFTLNILSGLEAYAIERAAGANRYTVENKQTPKFKIPEYDKPIIEELYEEIEFIMATLGYKLYSADSRSPDAVLYQTRRRGVVGKGLYWGERFEVLPGSQIDLSNPVGLPSYNEKRQRLLETGGITQGEDGKFYLRVSVDDFKTPSGASDFVLGGSTSGWTEWRDPSGKTLDELIRKPRTGESGNAGE